MSTLPREPFDSDEAIAARAYRALPGGEPSAEIDARVLQQARNAAIKLRKRQRPWFMGAGFGAAAAAVMAAGIGWQLGWLGSVPGSVTAPAARSETTAGARQKPAQEEAIERVDIDYIKSERKADDAPMPAAAPAAPPAPAAPEVRRRNQPAPPPPPASDDLREVLPVMSNEPRPQPFPAEAAAEADAVLDAAASGAAASERELAKQPASQSAPAPARSIGLAKQIVLPPWGEDAALEPDAWLERIRERVRQGDRQGAEHSLRRFVLMHPQRAVPNELLRLLVE